MASSTRTAALAIPREQRIALIGVVGFAAAVAAASQLAMPIPGTAVPLTLQPMLVVLAGLWLGPRRGAASMFLFLAAGAAGLPVFAPIAGLPHGVMRFLGPTGGYLWMYPVAAFVAGALGARATTWYERVLAAAAGILTLFVGGVAQLAVMSGDLFTAIQLGFLPFVAVDAAKAILAGLLAPRRNARTRE
ncbi:MAG: biotin transporter BioY [Gemmatimonadota bacterium]|nr:biotin transporter BioY [Gemmatimonadota bacterium]